MLQLERQQDPLLSIERLFRLGDPAEVHEGGRAQGESSDKGSEAGFCVAVERHFLALHVCSTVLDVSDKYDSKNEHGHT